MSLVNYATREITCKIVYYGPGRSGKTTNLQYIYSRVPWDRKGEMVSLATEADRTLFFDFLPLDLGQISSFSTRFQLYTVPGQVYYNATRKLVLRGADGVVFVADSQRNQIEDDIDSFKNLQENLLEHAYVSDSRQTHDLDETGDQGQPAQQGENDEHRRSLACLRAWAHGTTLLKEHSSHTYDPDARPIPTTTSLLNC